MFKVMTIVGTRPELIKLSRVIDVLDKNVKHTLVHTGQNFDYELNEIFFKDLEIRKPDYYLDTAGGSAIETIAQVLVKSDKVLEEVKPDALLLYGDTNSCISVLAAKRRKIPIFHMEAGNRCFDLRVPEEINRKIVDHLSDINLPLTEQARDYLVSEGIRPDTVIKSGSCMKEVLNYYWPKIQKSKALEDLKLTKNGYFLVSIHREENVDNESRLSELVRILSYLADQSGKKILVSTHPRTRKRLEESKNIVSSSNVLFMKPFGFSDYVFLQTNAHCVISDSGTVAEESGLLKFPAITIREAHERPEGMDAGVLIMAPLKLERIIEAIEVSVRYPPKNPVVDYETEIVSEKILKIILSYTAFVNRTVWSRPEF